MNSSLISLTNAGRVYSQLDFLFHFTPGILDLISYSSYSRCNTITLVSACTTKHEIYIVVLQLSHAFGSESSKSYFQKHAYNELVKTNALHGLEARRT